MPENELRKLEPALTSAAELFSWTSQIEKATTAADIEEISFAFTEAEIPGLSQEQRQTFWGAVNQKKAELSPASALANLHTQKEKAKAAKPRAKATHKKAKKAKKEETR